MADEQAIRARLGDDWPEGKGVRCDEHTVGGLPRLTGTRWWVANWGDQFEQFNDLGLTEDEQRAEADVATLRLWPDFTSAQMRTAGDYYLANRALFLARNRLTSDTWELTQLYRTDCAALLALLDAARAEREAARAVLAECDPIYFNEYREPRCALCGRASPELPQHDPECPWLLARARLARGAGGAGDVAASERGEG